ncbi:MAG: uracil-DNA glycosylase [Candidatus Abyssubacteria bacterium]
MKHDERADAELLEIIELAKQFLEQEKRRGLQSAVIGRETWAALEMTARQTRADDQKTGGVLLLDEVAALANGCTKCHLSATRRHVVFGEGNPGARLVFVGEAPGADEDAQGLPFVGKAGQLLTKIIEAIELKRNDVYICNVLKCRPPGNRTPTTQEIECCVPFLLKQLDAIQPKIICALGNVAAQTLLRTKAPMNRLRGRFHRFGNVLVMPTYHPAALLRNPDYKRDVWQDVQLIQQEYRKE